MQVFELVKNRVECDKLTKMWANFSDSDTLQLQLLLLSCLPTLLLIVPAVGRILLFQTHRIDVFSPVYIAAGCVFIGTTIRTIFLLYDPEAPGKMYQILGPYYPEDVLMGGLIVINLGVAAWIIGFLMPFQRARIWVWTKIHQKEVTRVIVPIAILCLFANLYYMHAIGFVENFSRLGISAKRFFSIYGSVGRETTFQYLKIGSDIAFAVLVVFASSLIGQKKNRRQRVFFWSLVFIAAMIPVIASIRGELVYLAIAVILIRHYSGKRVGISALIIVFLVAMALLTYLEILRQQARVGDRADEFQASRIVHTLVYTAHFIGVGKTSAIVEKFPDEFDYLNGSSYATLFIAPIPRVLWPEKPVVRIGRFVGTEVMERNSVTGVVPGIIGEAYMNFGKIGVVGILFMFGIFCKYVYVRFALSAGGTPFRLGLYAMLWIFMIDMFTSDFTGSMVRLLRIGGPYVFIVLLITFIKQTSAYSTTGALFRRRTVSP